MVTGVTVMQPVGSVYVILALPANIPVIIPEEEPIAAMAVLLLLHLPPVLASVSVADSPTHTSVVPFIVAGKGFTVTVANAVQPVPIVNVMEAVPGETPVTIPPASMLATAILPLAHVPLPEASLSDVVSPMQTDVVPTITDGNELTVITVLVMQPALSTNDIVDVPGLLPVITPVVNPMDATLVLLLVLVPLPLASVNVEV